jgi:hypothetical protein
MQLGVRLRTRSRLLSAHLSDSLEVFLTCYSIVAIHGIGAHPHDTWCQNVSTGEEAPRYVDWLKDEDMLPSVVPTARIMRYGYMSAWIGAQAIRQGVNAVAHRLLMTLTRLRKVGVPRRLRTCRR